MEDVYRTIPSTAGSIRLSKLGSNVVEIEENLWRGLDEEAEQRDMTVEQAFVEILGMRRKGK